MSQKQKEFFFIALLIEAAHGTPERRFGLAIAIAIAQEGGSIPLNYLRQLPQE